MSNTKRISELEQLLKDASAAYYGGEDAIMSDAEFDALRDELEELDPNNSVLADVGAPADSALTKVTHKMPMGSLKKINKVTEYKTWLSSVAKVNKSPDIAVQLKLDGLSVSIVYKKGKFVQAVTRGDGAVGEDVTHTIKNAKGFPKTVSTQGDVYVRAEALLPIASWKKHFSGSANPRNAASGTVRRTDGTGSEHLLMVAFDVVADDVLYDTEQERIDWLTNEKFMVTPTNVVPASDVEKIVKKIEDNRASLPYEIDGAVCKLNKSADQENLGDHNGRPYWARAWKFAAMGGHTVLEGVTWSVGTHGTINPVANVAPVAVGGTTIQNVTLHNVDEIKRLGLAIGDEVEVIRAGDVIPKIVRVVKQGKTRKQISVSKCPACGSGLTRNGVNLICVKKTQCAGVLTSRIKKWIKKRDIMYLGDSNTEALIADGTLKSIADIYSLTVKSMTAAGLGERMAEKILDEIDKSRTCTLAELMGSLSIDMLGRSEAKNLVGHGINSLDKWENLTAKQIESFPGYQAIKANRIATGVANAWEEIVAVADCLTIASGKPKVVGGKLSGKSFCFTGAMNKPRKELEDMVVNAGGAVRSVSKELSYLVIADVSSNSSKAVKARSLGTKLITEDEFLGMV